MKYQEFENQLQKEIRDAFNSEIQMNIRWIEKINRGKEKAILLGRRDQDAKATFYLNQLYQQYQEGESLQEIVRGMIKACRENDWNCRQLLEHLSSWEFVRSYIYPRLIPYEQNREILERIPHQRWLDLAVVLYYEEPELFQKQGTILLSNAHIENWPVAEEELFAIAVKNAQRDLPPCLEDIWGVINQSVGEWDEETVGESAPIYVLTNSQKVYGASCLLYPNLLEEIGERFNSDLYVLPSSQHECIILPMSKTEFKPEELKIMVREVNETMVSPQELLSYEVYRYLREEKQLVA